MRIRQLFLIAVVSASTALATLWTTDRLTDSDPSVRITDQPADIPTVRTALPAIETSTDFTRAAEIATPGVVHVRSIMENGPSDGVTRQDLFEWFFGPQRPMRERPAQASGSGVIVSTDGFVITNHHVIEDADRIEVTLADNTVHDAALVGRDPDTDIALVKIEGGPFEALDFADSDKVQIGEWVLAVGNPFNLASTVTAGIVSAKARSINILNNAGRGRANTAIESFIQTDAAVNPGNSGGALVNIDGELIGINTAIASPTGAYAGYSFAVPSNLVEKVMTDLREHGAVQRGFLGVNISDVTDEIAAEAGLPSPNGVYVQNVLDESAADDAGLEPGDIIIRINDQMTNTTPHLMEEVAEYRPGDAIEVVFVRDGDTRSTTVVLKNKFNGTEIIAGGRSVLDQLGIEIEELDDRLSAKLGIAGGIEVTKVDRNGLIRRTTDIRDGFIVTMVNDVEIRDERSFLDLLATVDGKVLFEGFYPGDRHTTLYAFRMDG